MTNWCVENDQNHYYNDLESISRFSSSKFSWSPPLKPANALDINWSRCLTTIVLTNLIMPSGDLTNASSTRMQHFLFWFIFDFLQRYFRVLLWYCLGYFSVILSGFSVFFSGVLRYFSSLFFKLSSVDLKRCFCLLRLRYWKWSRRQIKNWEGQRGASCIDEVKNLAWS